MLNEKSQFDTQNNLLLIYNEKFRFDIFLVHSVNI